MNKRIIIIVSIIMLVASYKVCAFFAESRTKTQTDTTMSPSMPFGDMMDQLSRNLSVWKNLNQVDKTKAIEAVIALYKQRENAAILNSADFYAKKLDEAISGNPSIMDLNVIAVIKILAVMEYDFYNGQNKDELAKQVLGDKMFESNKSRRQYEATRPPQ